MKTMIFAALFSFSSFATTSTVQDCFKIKNGLDRKYCMDKYLEGVKSTLAADKKTWAKGIDKKTKATKEAALDQELQAKKDYLSIVQEEINLTQKHLEELKIAKLAKAKVEKKEEKKKKDKGFRIKL
jgi:hypothetical protein